MTMGDRVVVMNKGRIEQVGRPKELYNRPQTLFVASFIGSPNMNLLPGTLESNGAAGHQVRVGNNVLPVPNHLEFGHDEVVVGVRREDLDVAVDTVDANGAVDRVTIEIDIVESVGSDTYVYGAVIGQEDGEQMVARICKDLSPAVGDQLSLVADPEQVLFFDAVTEQLVSSGAPEPRTSRSVATPST